MSERLHEELTGTIIGAYYEVYNHTSRTYPEHVYEEAMMWELRQRGLSCVKQDQYQVFYKDWLVGVQQLDLFVAQEVTVENKVAPMLTRLHKAQGISYLRTVGKSVGLLLNFGSAQPQIARLFLPTDVTCQTQPPSNVTQARQPPDCLYPELAYAICAGLYEVHHLLGPGFIHRIYARACYRELQARDLEVQPLRQIQVPYKGTILGDIRFAHLLINGQVMVFPVAIQRLDSLHLNDFKGWMRTQGIGLGILANFHALRLEPVYLRVNV
jgi:GxxExxY protein